MVSHRYIRLGEFSAHCFQKHDILAQGIKRFGQILRQSIDSTGTALLVGNQCRIYGNLLGKLQVAAQAVESCGDEGAQSNVWIGSGIRGFIFKSACPGALLVFTDLRNRKNSFSKTALSI